MDGVPMALTGPLVFGDPDQVQALQVWKRRIAEEAERKKNLKSYKVKISFSGDYILFVEAVNVDEARELAEDEEIPFGSLRSVYDVSIVCIEEVRTCSKKT